MHDKKIFFIVHHKNKKRFLLIHGSCAESVHYLTLSLVTLTRRAGKNINLNDIFDTPNTLKLEINNNSMKHYPKFYDFTARTCKSKERKK